MPQVSLVGLEYTYGATINITVDPKDIPVGSTYTGTVNVSGAGGLVPVTVTLNVLPAAVLPATFATTPKSVDFTYMQGDPIPPGQVISVSSTPTSMPFSLSSGNSGVGWLSVSARGGTTPSSLIASINPSGLSPGVYSGTIPITSSNAIKEIVPVALTVVGANAPKIAQGGIVPVYSSANSIQAGSWISIYGTNLAPTAAVWNGDFPSFLGGVTVTIDNKPAYLWFVSPTQINLQVPDDAAMGPVSVVVQTNTGTATAIVKIAQTSPAFSLLGDGKHVAGVIPRPDGRGAYAGGSYDLVGPTGSFSYETRPVKPGETLVLFGVGFGETKPAVPAGHPFYGVAPTVNPVTITIGGVKADIMFAGITSAGLYQFNLTVPDVGSGEQLLQATVSGTQTQMGAIVSIE